MVLEGIKPDPDSRIEGVEKGNEIFEFLFAVCFSRDHQKSYFIKLIGVIENFCRPQAFIVVLAGQLTMQRCRKRFDVEHYPVSHRQQGLPVFFAQMPVGINEAGQAGEFRICLYRQKKILDKIKMQGCLASRNGDSTQKMPVLSGYLQYLRHRVEAGHRTGADRAGLKAGITLITGACVKVNSALSHSQGIAMTGRDTLTTMIAQPDCVGIMAG